MLRTITTGCLLALAVTANAQEFGVELNGGLQGLQYNITGGKAKLQPGGSLGFNYNFALGKKWGLITGISGGYYQTKTTLDNGSVIKSYAVDEEASAFEFRVKPTGYEEKLRFFAAGIPVMLQYHTTGNTQWYLNGGGKVLFPFSAKTKASASELAMSGYYPDFNVELDNVPQHGFGKLTNWENEAKQDLKVTATLSAATGFSFPIGSALRLYTGVYIDYGLTDMRKSSDANAALVNYSPTGINNAQVNGILNKADDAKLLAYGVQVRLGFGKKKKETAPVAEPAPVVAPAPVETPAPVKPAAPAKLEAAVDSAVAVAEVVVDSAVAVAALSVAEEAVVAEPIVFATIGRTSVPAGMKSHLDSVANILKEYPELDVYVVGHTCDIGTEKENDKIGQARAKAVAAYLQAKGVAADRIHTSSAGPSQPLVPNDSNRNRSVNRRVTIKVQ